MKEFTEKEIENNRASFGSWVERSGNKTAFDPNSYHGKNVISTKEF